MPILKPTGSLSNSFKVIEELSRRCEGKNGYRPRPTRTDAAIFTRHAIATGTGFYVGKNPWHTSDGPRTLILWATPKVSDLLT